MKKVPVISKSIHTKGILNSSVASAGFNLFESGSCSFAKILFLSLSAFKEVTSSMQQDEI